MRGYRKHNITVSQVDDRAGYLRQYRKANPEVARRNVLRGSARRAAARRVADLHPDEYERFLTDELAKRGLK